MAWYGMVQYDMIWYGMVGYGVIWYGMVQYGMIWFGMEWYGVVCALVCCSQPFVFILHVIEKPLWGKIIKDVHAELFVGHSSERYTCTFTLVLSLLMLKYSHFSQRLIQTLSGKELELQQLNNGKVLLEQRLDVMLKQKEQELTVSTSEMRTKRCKCRP